MSLIFRQRRVGQHGKPFTIHKFETMRDGEVTRPFLRRTGLDELPQLWNILKGDMRLFGPRPEVPEKDAEYSAAIPEWARRHEVKPGLIGLAQVRGTVRGEDRFALETKAQQAREDCTLIDAGVWLRLKILALVPRAMLVGQES